MTVQTQLNTVKAITAEEYETEVLQFEGDVLVDFYAQWCGPCKMIAPVVEQIAQENESLKVVKIDADNSQELMVKYGIRGLPTLLLLKNGEPIATNVGASSVSKIRAFVNQ
ncbi:thioredoxin [Colwellia sp. 4_MG-2023]|uniref:thioredoxin n=1 Tax=unclassified Colwellia TaxID=196834 RepID=UPI0026E39755|nr:MULTISPECIES: thioredoxin [unclassified Colwellia]MDO6508343.1 thioredoxin [Colwellia sp. 5_MG-2023]MDO6556915.1 thioredoxin [Colwellia sp. 4_MG-2023]